MQQERGWPTKLLSANQKRQTRFLSVLLAASPLYSPKSSGRRRFRYSLLVYLRVTIHSTCYLRVSVCFLASGMCSMAACDVCEGQEPSKDRKTEKPAKPKAQVAERENPARQRKSATLMRRAERKQRAAMRAPKYHPHFGKDGPTRRPRGRRRKKQGWPNSSESVADRY